MRLTVLICSVTLVLFSCVTYHLYSVDPPEFVLSHGEVRFTAGQGSLWDQNNKYYENAVLDSNGSLWSLIVSYRQKGP